MTKETSMNAQDRTISIEGNAVVENRRVPITGEYDTIVVGGGCAGIAAGIAAARTGGKTLLIEASSFLGGEITHGYQLNLGQPSFYHARKQLIRGIMGEIVTDLVKMGGCIRTNGSSPMNPEMLKHLALRKLVDAGAEVRLYTPFADAIVEDNVLRGIIIDGKGGRKALMAKRVVDCSGDADVAARAGAPFTVGRESDNQVQPLNMTFLLGGVDIDTVITYVKANPKQFGMGLNRTILQEHARPAIRVTGFFDITRQYQDDYGLKVQYTRFGTVPAGNGKQLVYVNMPRAIHYDPLDPCSRTQADLMLRDQLLRVHDFLRHHIPGFVNSFIVSTSPWVAIRESRLIEGEYRLDSQEILAGKTFEDAILRSAIAFAGSGHPHPVDGEEGAEGSTYEYDETEWHEYEVPYGCVVPKKIDNLLVAGRCYSVTHSGLGLAKSVPVMAAAAQAAGTAAALSIQAGVTPRALDVRRLQERLVADGVNLPNFLPTS